MTPIVNISSCVVLFEVGVFVASRAIKIGETVYVDNDVIFEGKVRKLIFIIFFVLVNWRWILKVNRD
jgi:hypothetical protein